MDESTAEVEVEESTAIIGVEDLERIGHQEPETEGDTETDTDEVEESTAEVDAEGGEEEEELEELVEFDVGGKKITIPKSSMPDDVRDEFQNYVKAVQATSTKKSQEVAEMAKSLEARETAVKQFQAIQEQHGDTYAKAVNVMNEISQYQGALTPELMQTDPDSYRLYSDTLANKRAEMSKLDAEWSQAERAMAESQAQETARRIEEGKAMLERRIKGFNTKVDDIADYVSSNYGLDKEEAKRTYALGPAAAEMAYKAMLFDRMKPKTTATTKNKTVAATPVKPISGKGRAVTKDPLKMSMDQYVKHRATRK